MWIGAVSAISKISAFQKEKRKGKARFPPGVVSSSSVILFILKDDVLSPVCSS